MHRFSRFSGLLLAGLLAVVLANPAHASLVGYWDYENGGNLGEDGSGLGNDLTATGGPTQAAAGGVFGSGLELSGAGAMLDRAVFPTGVPVGGASYTSTSWINPDVGGARGIVGWGNYGSGNQVNAFRLNGTNQLVNYWWGNDMTTPAGADLTAGAPPAGWHHTTATYDAGTNLHKIYLDGNLVSSRTAGGLNVGASNFAVGRTCTFCGGGEFFDGRLDDTAVFSNPLAPNQVAALAKGIAQPNNLPDASKLISLYRFDNPGNVGEDTGVLGNHLDANGDAGYSAAGQFDGALQLDGNGDFLAGPGGAFPVGVPTENSNYTLSAWFKPDALTNPLGGAGGIIGWGDYGTPREVNALRLNGNGFRHYWWAADLDASAGAVNLLDGAYHNVMAVYDETTNTREIYLDGVLIGMDNPGNNNASPLNFAIGRTFGNEYFLGMLDDVAIFSDALTASERAAVLAGDFSGFLPPVPEPATGLTAMLGAVVLLRRRRVA